MWVVLVGPSQHPSAGATAVGEALAQRLGWEFDGDIGDQECFHDVLKLELQRDAKRAGKCRVVESWHFGRGAWAAHQGYRSEVVDKFLDAARKATEAETVIGFTWGYTVNDRVGCWMKEEPQKLKIGTEALVTSTDLNQTAATLARNVLRHRFCSAAGCTEIDAVVGLIQRKLLDSVVAPFLIFPTFQDARNALRSASHVIPELDKSLPRECLGLDLSYDRDLRYPVFVVVVEGLDGSGKSTLVKRLQSHAGSNAMQIRSPTDALGDARTFIEEEVQGGFDFELKNSTAFKRLKRAFFTFGNYVLASELLRSKEHSPVIIDRFASSTVAYTWGSVDAESSAVVRLVRAAGDSLLPFLKRAVWPTDLPKPDVVLLLDADESVRKQRIHSRSLGKNVGIGEWETAFERNSHLGPAIMYHLKGIQGGPPIEVIDANADDAHEVFCHAALKLMDYGVAFSFRQVVSAATCEAILHDFSEASNGRLPQGKLDRYKWDSTNKEYESHRHRNVGLCFLESEELKTRTIATICHAVEQATGLVGWAVEDAVLPVFRYRNDGEIFPHRDVNLTRLCDYCAVLMLSKPGIDFQKGALYVNGSATTDTSGQPTSEATPRRQYFDDLRQGDIVVFRNSQCIHGVNKVVVDEGSTFSPRGRITTSFRV